VRNVTDRTSDPFDLDPPCERSVPGYGDANAHFHVVGDHPGRHGGAASGVPFTGTPAADRLQRALRDGGLLEETGTPPVIDRTYLSYLHMCVVEEGRDPTPAEYADMERFFDAELRAIAAHVLLPVGARATDHVLRTYSARAGKVPSEMDDLHGTEILGAGFLILPIKDPAEWVEGDHERLVAGLRELQRTDFRREVDLGRFLAGDDPYMVR
jgi:uracil-DNA glycosylase family 4